MQIISHYNKANLILKSEIDSTRLSQSRRVSLIPAAEGMLCSFTILTSLHIIANEKENAHFIKRLFAESGLCE